MDTSRGPGIAHDCQALVLAKSCAERTGGDRDAGDEWSPVADGV